MVKLAYLLVMVKTKQNLSNPYLQLKHPMTTHNCVKFTPLKI